MNHWPKKNAKLGFELINWLLEEPPGLIFYVPQRKTLGIVKNSSVTPTKRTCIGLSAKISHA